VGYGVVAYVIWGLVPLYFMAVRFATPSEVLAHRVVWSVLLLTGLLLITRQLSTLMALRTRQWRGLALSAVLLATNWLIYVWALFNGRMLEASLGYFINPLVTVMLGVVVLAERPGVLGWIALGIAAAGVGHEIVVLGRLPWVALALAASFGLYGLVRKQLGVASLGGLTAETLILLPAALAYMFHLYGDSPDPVAVHAPVQWLLLIVGGLVTILPLLAFAASALRIPLTVLGFLQYLSPSIAFALALLVFDERLREGQMLTFALIWLALVIFSLEGLYDRRRSTRGRPAS